MTGESFPNVSESRVARVIVVDIKPTSIDLHKLKEIQDNIEKLSYTMEEYIGWIIPAEKTIVGKALKMQEQFREKEIGSGLHGRTLEAIQMLIIGFTLFLDFLYEKGVITPAQKEEMEKEGISVLEGLAEGQREKIETNKPTELYIEAVKQMCASGKAQVMKYDIPCDTKLTPNLIGFYDNSEGLFYMMPDVSYGEVTKFYRGQGVKFPVSKASLQKMLAEEGYLYVPTKNDRKTVKRKLPTNDTVSAVWAIYQDKLGLEPYSVMLQPLENAYDMLRDNLRKENTEKEITKKSCEK